MIEINGDYILRRLIKINKRQVDLSKTTGVTRATVSNWCNGISLPNGDVYRKLLVALDLTLDVNGEIIPVEKSNVTFAESITVPILNTIQAGIFSTSCDNFEETIPLPKDWIPSKNCFILIVSGQSMFNLEHKYSMREDDWLVVDADQKNLKRNTIYVIRNSSGEATVKLYVDDGKPVLMPLNKDRDVYPIIPAADGMQIIGKVVQIIPKPTKL